MLSGIEIAPGMQVDHLCRNRRCVRPDHLEVVTQAENILRGQRGRLRESVVKACPKGHPYDSIRKSDGSRVCTECKRESTRAYHSRNRQALNAKALAYYYRVRVAKTTASLTPEPKAIA